MSVKKNTKLTEGQYLIRGALSTSIALTLLTLPVVTNVVSYELGFPLIFVIVMVISNLGRPSPDEVDLGTPRWKWTLLRIFVWGAFLLASFACVHFMREGGLHLTTLGGPDNPLISINPATASQVIAICAYIVFWILPVFFISSYCATAIARIIVGRKKAAET